MKIPLQILCMVMVTFLVSACGASKSKTTKSDSRTFATLADKKAFIERYVTFRHDYDTLDFLIDYRDGGDGGLPSPTEWNVRLVATIPANEIDGWTIGLTATKEAETDWISDIANAPSELNAFEWYGDTKRLVGIDRMRRIVVYRNRTL